MAATKQTKIDDMFGAAAGAVDRLPMLRVCMAGVPNILFEQMRATMSSPPRASLTACQSMTAEDAFALHGGPCAISVLSTSGWGGLCYMTCDKGAAFLILEMLLGADPSEAPVMLGRDITKLERKLAGVFFKTMCSAISAAFASVAETSFEIVKSWAQPDFDEVKPRSAMIVARFAIEGATRKGNIHFLVPNDALAPVREALSTLPKTDSDVNDETWEERIRAEFNRSQVTVAAILDERPGTLGEIASLRVGDVLPINATADSHVVVETNGERLMYCLLGKSGDVYTLRVEEFVNKEQELMANILAA
jgi:flagellar motor switch protein FliM